MLKNSITYLIMLIAMSASAQQEIKFTQYQFNMLAYNPAYTGSREAISITSIYRHQWTGLAGAPRIASINVHSPLKDDRIALGLQVSSDQHGLSSFTSMEASYAYRLPVGSGKLSMAVDGGATIFRLNAAGALVENPNDPSLAMAAFNKTYPTIGAGLFYYDPNLYAGISINNLIRNRLNSFANPQSESDPAHTVRHIFATAGYLLKVSSAVKFRPTAMLSITENAALQWEASGSILLVDKFWLGGGIRSSAAYTGHIQFNATPQLRFGYAYDYETTELSGATGGTHEMLIGFDLDYKNKSVVTPRQMTPAIL